VPRRRDGGGVWRRKRDSVRRRESEERERRGEMEVVVDEPNKIVGAEVFKTA